MSEVAGSESDLEVPSSAEGHESVAEHEVDGTERNRCGRCGLPEGRQLVAIAAGQLLGLGNLLAGSLQFGPVWWPYQGKPSLLKWRHIKVDAPGGGSVERKTGRGGQPAADRRRVAGRTVGSCGFVFRGASGVFSLGSGHNGFECQILFPGTVR